MATGGPPANGWVAPAERAPPGSAHLSANRRLAAEASDAALAELHAALEATVADRDAFFTANERFHTRLLELAGNRWRCQMVADLRKVMKPDQHQLLFKAGGLEASLAEARAILAALRARDAEGARRLVQQHLEHGKDAAMN